MKTSIGRRYYDSDAKDENVALCGASFIVGTMMGVLLTLMWLS